jgi:hypothetical protein
MLIKSTLKIFAYVLGAVLLLLLIIFFIGSGLHEYIGLACAGIIGVSIGIFVTGSFLHVATLVVKMENPSFDKAIKVTAATLIIGFALKGMLTVIINARFPGNHFLLILLGGFMLLLNYV